MIREPLFSFTTFKLDHGLRCANIRRYRHRISCRIDCWLWEQVRGQHTLLARLSDRSSLVPLTSDNGDESSPKALLPIANRPMIEYPLAWLEQSEIKGISSCLLLMHVNVSVL
jgi:hypothetical protein